MSYKAGVVEAIKELKDRNGSSMIAIKKVMQGKLPEGKTWQNKTFLETLKKSVAAGDLVQNKNSYKLSADFKKKEDKAAKPKKAAPKKAAPKKAAPKKSTTTKKKTTTTAKAAKPSTKTAKPKTSTAKAPAKKTTTTKPKAPAKVSKMNVVAIHE